MPTTTVQIKDEDRRVDHLLTVDYSISPVSRSLLGRLFSMLEGDYCLEIDKVLCIEIVTWCGDYGVTAFPFSEMNGEQRIGDWCWEQYESDIELAVDAQLDRGGDA